ncbi:protein kinase domain-containing protein, partial [Staphylococcus epidermidis]|uniref:protein kinase domain-containing protein n=1 Tax=Staphylococcus epidermidis TaxID=1282 RepID=UPI0011A11795
NSSQLSHHNIVTIIDLHQQDHSFYILIQYIQPPTLPQYIHTHPPLTLQTPIHFTQQIFTPIKHPHDMTILHPHIKPHNILIHKNKK